MRQTVYINLLSLAAVAGCAGPRTPGELRSQLFADNPQYERDTRPNLAVAAAADVDLPWEAAPDEVEIGMWITMLSDVSAKTSTFTLESTTIASWKDARLRFNTSDAGGCHRPGRPVEFELGAAAEIWTPDLFFNTMVLIGPKDDSTKGGTLMIWDDGKVELHLNKRQTFSCNFNFQKAPFDEQYCTIHINVYHEGKSDQIQFTSGVAVPPWEDKGTPSWTIVDIVGYNKTFFGGSNLFFDLTIRRESGYYIWTVLVPANLFVVVSWASFFISRAAVPARVGMTVSSLLIISNFHNMVLQQLPQYSGFVYMVWWVRVSLFFCMYAVLEFAAVNLLTRNEARFDRAIAEIAKERESRTAAVEPTTGGISVTVKDAPGRPSQAEIQTKVAKVSKLSNMLVNKHGKLCVRDQHPDIVSRWLFLPMYMLILIVIYPW